MVVFDVDINSVDDFVDAILVTVDSSVNRGFSNAESFSGVFNYGHLQARFRVDCNENFYGEGNS